MTGTPPDQRLLACHDLHVAIGARRLVDQLNFGVSRGDWIAVLGPNGVGKTLTLLTLAGLRAPAAGQVQLNGAELGQLPRAEIARQLGMLLQHQADPFPTSVLDTALLGCHARRGIWRWESAEDRARARDALVAVDLAGLEERTAATLSGGERRRLALATVLAQDPDLLILDEPLNHLDPQHRFSVLAGLRQLCARGKAIIASLHDPSLATQYATHALLLHGDGHWQFGPTATMLTTANLEALYSTPFLGVQQNGRHLLLPVAPDSLTAPDADQ